MEAYMPPERKDMNTVFTIILPDTEGDVRATLIARRGNNAHVDSFSYDAGNLMTALQAAISELDLLERIPPQIEAPSNPPNKDKSPKVSKPKKKKVTLDDFPDDESVWGGDDSVELSAEHTAQSNLTTVPTNSIHVGMTITLEPEAVDVDGDPVPFESGRVLEIDHDAESPRVWIESNDGEQDVWMNLVDVEAVATSVRSADEQLNLFR
jgi:hypothetical protein